MKNILIWVGGGVGIVLLGVSTYTMSQKPASTLSEATVATTSSSISTTTSAINNTYPLDMAGISSDNLIQDEVTKPLSVTDTKTEKISPPASPVVPTRSQGSVAKGSREECAKFVSETIAKDALEYPPIKYDNYPSYLPKLDPRVREVTYQLLRYDSVIPECILRDDPIANGLSTSTLYDFFGQRILGWVVNDDNAPAQDADYIDQSCVILGKRGCTNQQFVDYVHAAIKGDITDSTQWQQLSSADYGYRVFLPNKPFLEFSTTTEEGNVLGFETR
jgi:hypothetical protein